MEKEIKMSKNLNGDSFFKPAGNIENNNFSYENEETDEEFLSRVASGVSYRYQDGYQMLSAGKTITTMAKVKQMVEAGYNIINATILSEIDGNVLVEVEFEQLKSRKNNKAR